MKILSIDVGTKNLAFCLYDNTSKVIHNWDASGIPTESTLGLFPCLLKHLRSMPWTLTTDIVLIEKQPEHNKRMKSVEHFLYSYFLISNRNVQLWDARHKVPDIAGPGKAQYRKRKQAAIQRCETFLVETQSQFLSFFRESKKKDDLADTVLQAISYGEPAPKVQKVPKARRPTLNQTSTKYSKANLAWLYSNDPTNKRFDKDLHRYYKNINELIEEFKIKKKVVSPGL